MSKPKKSEKSKSLPEKFREHPWLALREEMEDLVSRFFGTDEDGPGGKLSPSIDLSESDTTVEVTMDLPGVTPEEIEIQLVGNTLHVRGQRHEEKEETGKTYHRAERRSGSFSRSITLPCAVNENEVAAEYKKGVLTVTLPKREEAKSRKIEVKH